MTTHFDLTPLLRSAVGFDRMTELLENSLARENSQSYPPYNIIKLEDNEYRISIAVAGFAEEDLEITVQDNSLIVRGNSADSNEEDEIEYLHKGIASRSFERRFQIADYIKITSASIKNGMLSIELYREIPERMKPRNIDIINGDNLIEQKKTKQKA